MKKEKSLCFAKIAKNISNDKEEQEVLQYGLHQGFIILINAVTLVICGIFWDELEFTLLAFLGLFFLRPYAGGYHADTEWRCYLVSTIIMNIAVLGKKMIIWSDVILICIWIETTVFIWKFAPVENPIHCLDEKERKKYAKITKRILLYNGCIVLLGKGIGQQFLMEVVVCVQVLVGFSMLAGLWKYKICYKK